MKLDEVESLELGGKASKSRIDQNIDVNIHYGQKASPTCYETCINKRRKSMLRTRHEFLVTFGAHVCLQLESMVR